MEVGLQRYNAGTKLMQWIERVSACRSSGMRVKDWCIQEGISEKTYYDWQRKVFQASRSQEERFVEISGVREEGRATVATIKADALSVEIRSGADEETLAALLRAIRSC